MGSINDDTSSIPSVDLSRWDASPESPLNIGRQLVHAFRTYGFAYITSHPIPQSSIDQAFAQSARLFNLPTSQKMLAPHPPGFSQHRGYSYIGKERSAGYYAKTDEEKQAAEKVQDVRESFEVGRDDNEREPNVHYPEEVLPGFRAWSQSFYHSCSGVARILLQAISLGIGCPKDHLLQYHSLKYDQMRLAHYPAVPAEKIERGEAVRLSTHTDFDTLTMVFQDEVGGLEVKNPFDEGEGFVSVVPVKGAIVVNVGDYLMRWTNDSLISNQHRVELPPLADRIEGEERMTRERYSIPFFVSPDLDVEIETIPGCVDEEHPRKYEKITVKEYREEKFKKILPEVGY